MVMKFDYQKIDGIYPDGIDRSPDYDIIFKKKPKGLSILDLGCYLGYYLLRAKEEGASMCFGVDQEPVRLKEAKRIAGVKGYDIKYICSDVMITDFDFQLDVVLCLNLLHHLPLKDVNKLLSKISGLATQRAVFTIITPEVGKGIDNITMLLPEQLQTYFPEWKMEIYDAVSTPKRLIVSFTK